MRNQLIEVFDISSKISNSIKYVIDQSDKNMKRLLIVFNNGYKISIIQGQYAYSGDDTFEIAVFDKNDNWVTGEFTSDVDGMVCGWRSIDDIKEIMTKIIFK